MQERSHYGFFGIIQVVDVEPHANAVHDHRLVLAILTLQGADHNSYGFLYLTFILFVEHVRSLRPRFRALADGRYNYKKWATLAGSRRAKSGLARELPYKYQTAAIAGPGNSGTMNNAVQETAH